MMSSFVEAVLKAKVAQICSHVGYNAITIDSSNILIDIYRRTLIHLARHCKEAANNNRRVEPTLADLIQAYDFVGISIPELQDHIKNDKLPFEREILKDDSQPSNRIQRDLLVDDQLDAKKTINADEQDEDGENKLSGNERGTDDEETAPVPLLKDVYQDIAKNFPSPSSPIKADKLRIKREEKPAIPRLKITPLDPAVAEPPSFLPLLDGSTEERSIPVTIKTSQETPPIERKRGPKVKSKTKAMKIKNKTKTKPKTKIKTKPKSTLKLKKGRTKSVGDSAKSHVESLLPENVSPIENNDITSPPAAVISTPSPPPQKQPTPNLEQSHIISPPPQDSATRTPTPSSMVAQTIKPSTKVKKKKKRSSNQFSIVTESVTASADINDGEWLCPTCNGPDNGDLMLQCEGVCELWFHLKCTGLKEAPDNDEKWECISCSKPKAKASSAIKKSSKGKKRLKTSQDTYVKIESKTPTPQPPTPTPTLTKQHGSKSPAAIHPLDASIKHEPINDSQIVRPSVICTSTDDLCPECQLGDDGTLMIMCEDPDCAKWFHGKCVNVLSAPGKDDSWFCKLCIEKQQSAFKRRRRVK